MIQELTIYINDIMGGNQFATGMVVTGVIGYTTFLLKSIPKKLSTFIKKHITTTLHIRSNDDVFLSILQELNSDDIIKKVRSIRFSNDKRGLKNKVYMSIGFGTHIIKYKNTFMKFKMEEDSNTNSDKKPISISITKLGRSHKKFNDMIDDIIKKESKKNKDRIIFKNSDGYWIGSGIKVQKGSTILTDSNTEKLYSSIDTFIEKEEWYKRNNIPYHLGILLYGVPGTGKTSLIREIASYLNRDIRIVNNIKELEDASLTGKESILALEEIDTFGSSKRNTDNTDDLFSDVGRHVLGSMLKSLDGIAQPHGRIIIMTTNNKEDLDDALIRSGRVDLSINLDYANNEIFKKFMKRFFEDEYEEKLFEEFEIKEKISPADIQKEILNGLKLNDMIKQFNRKGY